MNIELLLIIKKHKDTLIEQTKTKPQETLEFKMNKQMPFLFTTNSLVEEGKWLPAVFSFKCTNSVFNITNENSSFLITKPSHWETKSAEKTFSELNKLLGLRSLDLHVKEVRERRNQIKKGDNEYILSDFYTQKNEILEELKNVKS